MIFLTLCRKWEVHHSISCLSELFCCICLKESWKNWGKTIWVLFFCPKDFLKWYKSTYNVHLVTFTSFPWALTPLLDTEEWSLPSERGGAWTMLSLLGERVPALGPGSGSVDSFGCGFPRNDCMSCWNDNKCSCWVQSHCGRPYPLHTCGASCQDKLASL